MLNILMIIFFSQDAKIAKPEVNLMSLLSSFDDVSLLQPEDEETDTDKDRGEAPKLPRTNSLEDLGIKVLPFDLSEYRTEVILYIMQ